MSLPLLNSPARIYILFATLVILGTALGAYFWTTSRAEGLVKGVVTATHEGDKLAFSPLKFTSSSRVCGQWATILGNGELGGWHPFIVIFQRGWAFTWREPMVLEQVDFSQADLALSQKPAGATDKLSSTLAEYERLAAADKVAERRRFDQLSVGCVPATPQVRS